MSKKLFSFLSLLVIFSVLLAACGGGAATTEAPAEEPAAPVATEPPAAEAPACEDAIGCVEIAPGEPVHIAYALSVSGATAPLGEDVKGSVEIAIDDRGGELLGHPIELTGEDTLCNAEGGQAAGTKIAADPTIIGVVGTTCSSEARAAMPLISQAGMVMISASNTNPDLTDPNHPDHHPGYFRTAHNDLFQGAFAAEFAYSVLGLKKAATIHDGSPYAESLQRVFAEKFVEYGGTITAQEAINVGDTDMKPVLTKIATDPPEIIYFPIFEPEGDLIAAQAKEVAGLEDVKLMGADGLFSDTFPEATGSASVGMFLSGPYVSVDNPDYQAFLDKWNAKFGTVPPSGYHAMGYDGTNIMLNAIEQVAIQGADGTLYIPRQALRDAMHAVKDYPGITGKLACDANGDCATGEALGVFMLRQEELDGNWPPPVYWTKTGGLAEQPAPVVEGEPLKVGLVTDVGEVDDKSFNQSAWEGVQKAADELGAEVKFIETKDAKDYGANIDLFAEEGYNVIVTVGFALGTATAEAAAKYPDINFIGVDQFQVEALPNVAGLIFSEDKSGFLAGALAAMMSTSGTVAGVYGTDLVPPVVAFKVGYENGAKYINPDINVISTFHPGGLDVAFTDPEWGATTAKQAIDQGADIVFGAGGKTGNGALIEVAGNPGLYCIGVDTDQWETVPEAHPCLISSAMKLITPSVFDLIKAAQGGTFPGGNYVGGVGLAPFHDFDSVIPQDVKDKLTEIDAGLQDGSILTGYTP